MVEDRHRKMSWAYRSLVSLESHELAIAWQALSYFYQIYFPFCFSYGFHLNEFLAEYLLQRYSQWLPFEVHLHYQRITQNSFIPSTPLHPPQPQQFSVPVINHHLPSSSVSSLPSSAIALQIKSLSSVSSPVQECTLTHIRTDAPWMGLLLKRLVCWTRAQIIDSLRSFLLV